MFGRSRFTPVELAVGVALGGSFLAVAIPTFLRELHGSRFTEAEGGVTRLGRAAVAYAEARTAPAPFPPSAPLTPAAAPRGVLAADPPGTWDTGTWRALAFRPAPEGVPHAFAFAFESTVMAEVTPRRSTFVAVAHGDLDGDGVTSTFEVRGYAEREPASSLATAGGGAVRGGLEPGMYVSAETE